MRYRLIKPRWAENNDDVPGPNVLEGDNLSEDYLREKNAEGYGIYYFPNYNSCPVGTYLSGKSVDVFSWVFVDMDLKDGVYATKEDFIEKLISFEVSPNHFVLSGNGVHAYWRIKDLTREKYVALQLRLIKQFNTDKSIWTILRLMRLPGYLNTKSEENPKLVEIEKIHENSYSYNDLIKYLPTLSDEDVMRMTNHLRKIEGLDPVMEIKDCDINELPEKFLELLDRDAKVNNEFFYDKQGERSEKAYWLAHELFKRDFSRDDAVIIIANTPKALSHADRLGFALNLVDKVYRKEAKYSVSSVSDKIRENKQEYRRGRNIRGPSYFDCLHKGWKTQQVLGVVGSPGIGKSTVTLDIFKSIIENSEGSDDICVYFNLEMMDWEIIEKWTTLNNNSPKMNDRLHVISNEDEEGNPRNINLQKILWHCRDIQKVTGKKIAAIAIDHIGVINSTIDIREQPNFGMEGEVEGAYGDYRNISARRMPQLIKELAKQLDVFIVLQSQTTKAKGMDGDLPLSVDAAYGAAQFEQFCDYLITLFQPLRRVHDKTDLRALGWQYCKIRSKHKQDLAEVYVPQILGVDIDTGVIAALTEDEKIEYAILSKEATVLRKKSEKKEEIQYKFSKGLTKLKALLAIK